MITELEENGMSMSSRKEILLIQMCACQDQDGWFAPLNVALRGVTVDQAIRHGKQTGNSIMGIVRHPYSLPVGRVEGSIPAHIRPTNRRYSGTLRRR